MHLRFVRIHERPTNEVKLIMTRRFLLHLHSGPLLECHWECALLLLQEVEAAHQISTYGQFTVLLAIVVLGMFPVLGVSVKQYTFARCGSDADQLPFYA